MDQQQLAQGLNDERCNAGFYKFISLANHFATKHKHLPPPEDGRGVGSQSDFTRPDDDSRGNESIAAEGLLKDVLEVVSCGEVLVNTIERQK